LGRFGGVVMNNEIDECFKHDNKSQPINDEAKLLASWRMQGYSLLSSRLNFLLVAQSIFLMAFIQIIMGGEKSTLIYSIAIVIAISGMLLTSIFGYVAHQYYRREFHFVDLRLEGCYEWFDKLSKYNLGKQIDCYGKKLKGKRRFIPIACWLYVIIPFLLLMIWISLLFILLYFNYPPQYPPILLIVILILPLISLIIIIISCKICDKLEKRRER
jgi:hypothetical protein